MAEAPKKKWDGISADDLTQHYKQGYSTYGQYQDALREKAHEVLADQVSEAGLVGLPMLMLKRSVEHVQEGWNDYVTALTADTGQHVVMTGENKKAAALEPDVGELKRLLNAFFAELKILGGLFGVSGAGEVSGMKAEQTALQLGASQGVARALNIAVDLGVGFAVPTGKIAQGFAKGVQAAGRAVAKTEKVVDVTEAAQAAKVVQEGLKAEGLGDVATRLPNGAVEVLAQPKPQTLADEFYQAFAKFKTEMASISAVKHHEQTLKEAAALGITEADLANIPGKLNEAEMAAYLKALEPAANRWIRSAKENIAGVNGAHEKFMQDSMELFTKLTPFRQAEVTAGRTVEILKETPPAKAISDMLIAWDAENMAKNGIHAAGLTLAEDAVAMEKNLDKIKALSLQGQNIFQRFGATGWPMMKEAYINLLLARPVTHVRNFVGNVIGGATNVAERQVAGWLSIDQRAGVTNNEGWYAAKGMMFSIADGIKAFGDAFKIAADAGKLDVAGHKIPGLVGRFVNLPGDALRGSDAFFKALFSRGDMYAMALRHGKQELGLVGDDLARYVAARSWAPTIEMQEHATAVAKSATYQDDLGKFGSRIQKALQSGPLSLWFPFVKTPINLIKYSWDRTPGLQLMSGKLYKDILAGGEAADMAIARLTLSNLVGAFLYQAAQDKLITGGGPADAGQRSAWLLSHTPYSVAGKDGWIPYSNYDPQTTPTALIADFAEIHNQLEEESAAHVATGIGLSIARDIGDKSWALTIGNITDMMSHLKAGDFKPKDLTRLGLSPAIAVATGGPLGQAVTRAIEGDATRKDARGVLDEIRSRLPGYGNMKAMLDGVGEPITPPQALGGPWVGLASPVLQDPYKDDWLRKEIGRLQVSIPRWPDSIGGAQRDDFDVRAAQPGDALPVELTPDQKYRWGRIYNELIRHGENGIEASFRGNEEYKNATWPMQRSLLQGELSSARKNAQSILEVEDPHLAKRKIEAQAGKVLPLVQPDQRDEIMSLTKEATDQLPGLLPQQREQLIKSGIYSGENR